MHLGNYQEAADYFTSALKEDKISKSLKKDILSYRQLPSWKQRIMKGLWQIVRLWHLIIPWMEIPII